MPDKERSEADPAAYADRSRGVAIETLLHDLRAPLAALRADVDFLTRGFKELPEYRIHNKLDDMALDCELALLQVAGIESFFGAPQRPQLRERSVVFRDIVIKSLNQIRGRVMKSGIDPNRIEYDPRNAGRIVLYVDPAELNDVVLNLLMNSVKYAENEPSAFKIRVELDESPAQFVLRFMDWGIGVRPEYASSIFESGFRTPEARAHSPVGSGLGLSIARSLMREMGGDLLLTRTNKPTEFQVILPKNLKESARDPAY